MKIAIAVQHDLTKPNISSNDWLIKPELEKLGMEVDVIDWRDSQVDLNKYDSIFVSSVWNAADYYTEFLAWIHSCEKNGKKLINDKELLLLGVHKDTYLGLLKEQFGDQDAPAGSITPSVFIKPGDEFQSLALMQRDLALKDKIWQGELVIKPIVSAEGRDTYLITDKPELLRGSDNKYTSFKDAESIVQQLLKKDGTRGLIVQPFMHSVETNGEYQLMFFENQFSHAIVKAKGFGNRVASAKKAVSEAELPSGMLDFAQRIMQFYSTKFPHGVTRARLDFFVGEKGAVLCEAEVVDPHANIRRFSAEQKKSIISRYAQALLKRTVELKIEAFLGKDAQQYFTLLKNPDLLKTVIKIAETNQNIMSYLATSGAKQKHDLAMNYSPNYIKDCLNALNAFSDRNYQNKDLLITELNHAKDKYTQTVLGKDRSSISLAVRLLLMTVVNFVAGLTFGLVHYNHYKSTGVIGFFTETNSASQLRKNHQELNQELEQSFSL